jgi:hypothetical protein|tara:strand:+ start:1327 stop:1566 length:240 start_codon:yes stop_codon:yes gene_type:complete
MQDIGPTMIAPKVSVRLVSAAKKSEAKWQILDEFGQKKTVCKPNRSCNSEVQVSPAATKKLGRKKYPHTARGHVGVLGC